MILNKPKFQALLHHKANIWLTGVITLLVIFGLVAILPSLARIQVVFNDSRADFSNPWVKPNIYGTLPGGQVDQVNVDGNMPGLEGGPDRNALYGLGGSDSGLMEIVNKDDDNQGGGGGGDSNDCEQYLAQYETQAGGIIQKMLNSVNDPGKFMQALKDLANLKYSFVYSNPKYWPCFDLVTDTNPPQTQSNNATCKALYEQLTDYARQFSEALFHSGFPPAETDEYVDRLRDHLKSPDGGYLRAQFAYAAAGTLIAADKSSNCYFNEKSTGVDFVSVWKFILGQLLSVR